MTVAAIHQPQYLPYLGFFHKLAHGDVLVVLDTVQFHRRGLQHRNKIKTSQGWQWLTVPVSSSSHEVLGEVRVSQGEPWQAKHARGLELNYARAPHFDRHAPDLVEVLVKPWERLSELDIALTEWVMERLDIRIRIVYASELGASGTRSELLANLCREVGADTYLSGPGGRRYMDEGAFEAAGVEVRWQEFEHPTYAQLFPNAGFVPNLSIVDVLFCCGVDATMAWSRGDAAG